jgi:hypothetical protein
MSAPPLLQMSHAVERKNHSSLRNALLFGLIVFVFWILTLVVPFYAWALIVFAALLYHRYWRVAGYLAWISVTAPRRVLDTTLLWLVSVSMLVA